jgi:hypothetical protein
LIPLCFATYQAGRWRGICLYGLDEHCSREGFPTRDAALADAKRIAVTLVRSEVQSSAKSHRYVLRSMPEPSKFGPRRPAIASSRPRPSLLKLRFHDGEESFDTLDIINGLRGVCYALDRIAVTDGGRDGDQIGDLSMAAKVLSHMLGDRVEG